MQKRDVVKKRQQTKKKTRGFDPAYFNQPQNRHVVLVFRLEEDQSYSVIGADARPGKMPHNASSGGEFQVRLKDANEKVLGDFSYENPGVFRSCEEEKVAAYDGGRPLTFELALPFDRTLSTLEIQVGERKQEIRIDDYIKKVTSQ